MVQLLIIYFVLLLPVGIEKFPAAVLCFGFNSGAYVSEIIRGGIMSIDKGQMEAGRSLGLTKGATMRLIVLPQAIKNILPTLGNEFIALVKDTSVVSFVAAVDLYKTCLHKLSDLTAGIFTLGGNYFIESFLLIHTITLFDYC